MNSKIRSGIFIAIGLAALIAVAYLVYQPLNVKTRAMQTENSDLNTEISVLQSVSGSASNYKADTDTNAAEANRIIQSFPSQLQEEDLILYANALENKVGDLTISYIALPDPVALPLAAPAKENVLETVPDVTGEIAASSYVADGSIPDASLLQLYDISSDMTFTVSYSGLKRLIKEITAAEDKKSIENVSLSYDQTTGMLIGSINMNHFALAGNGEPYEEPKTGIHSHGVSNIFGTAVIPVDDGQPLSDAEGDIAGNDGIAAENQGNENAALLATTQTAPVSAGPAQNTAATNPGRRDLAQ